VSINFIVDSSWCTARFSIKRDVFDQIPMSPSRVTHRIVEIRERGSNDRYVQGTDVPLSVITMPNRLTKKCWNE
jgi:hypothetical protein